MNGSIIRQVFLLTLGLIYIGLGVYIFIIKVIGSPWSEILSVLFIVYGLWRVYRSFMKN